MSKIRVTVWGENVHERTNETVRQIYPTGMHHCIADALNAAGGIATATATLDQPDQGLPPGRLEETDVLIWWGHAAHGDVDDALVARICDAVWGHGRDLPAFRAFLEAVQAPDGRALQPQLA